MNMVDPNLMARMPSELIRALKYKIVWKSGEEETGRCFTAVRCPAVPGAATASACGGKAGCEGNRKQLNVHDFMLEDQLFSTYDPSQDAIFAVPEFIVCEEMGSRGAVGTSRN